MNNLSKLLKNKSLLSIVLSIFIFIFVYLFSLTSLNKTIQNGFLTLSNSELKENPWKISKDIVVVWIDEQTLQTLWRFPFSRDVYIKVIENLNKAWASVIAFDIIFADKTEKDIDNRFADAIKKAGNIVLWWAILWEASWREIELPLEKIKSSSLAFWYFTQDYENDLQVLHRFIPSSQLKINLSKSDEKIYFDNFSIAILKAYYSIIFKNKDLLSNSYFDKYDFYITKNKTISLSWKWHNMIIKFAPASFFANLSFKDVYDEKQLDLALKSVWKDFSLKDKIVIIWTTAKGIKDIFYTPNGSDYGVYVHTNIINTILTNNYHRYFDENLEYVLIFLLIIVSFYLNLSKWGFIVLFSNIALISLFLFVFPFLIYYFWLILNRPADLVIALILSLLVSNIVKYLVENKNKTRLIKALSEYISKDVAHKILDSWENLDMQWERKSVSIFFSDIAWFTGISEKFSPEKLVAFLREYLRAMSNIIMDERWFINKYEWDAIMALWWVFSYETTKTYDNCKQALLQQEKLRLLNSRFLSEYGEILKVRMWLHTWEAIVWNIWAVWRKMEFTALWDSVNLASRLEWVNKYYWTYICVSQSVVDEVKNDFVFRQLDKIQVKWKNESLYIYELIWFTWKIEDYKLDIISRFEKALKLYFEKDFKKASVIFRDLVDLWDIPSSIFTRRCLQFSIKAPEDNWDGVWVMEEK